MSLQKIQCSRRSLSVAYGIDCLLMLVPRRGSIKVVGQLVGIHSSRPPTCVILRNRPIRIYKKTVYVSMPGYQCAGRGIVGTSTVDVVRLGARGSES